MKPRIWSEEYGTQDQRNLLNAACGDLAGTDDVPGPASGSGAYSVCALSVRSVAQPVPVRGAQGLFTVDDALIVPRAA